jgi:hypothetical protein
MPPVPGEQWPTSEVNRRLINMKLGIVASVVPVTSSTAICGGLPVHRDGAHPFDMGTKSRETIYGASVRAAAERATEARKEADPGLAISKSVALAATPTRPLPSSSSRAAGFSGVRAVSKGSENMDHENSLEVYRAQCRR